MRATDGAGNAQSAAYATYTWQLTLPASYVALTGGDISQTIKRQASTKDAPDIEVSVHCPFAEEKERARHYIMPVNGGWTLLCVISTVYSW